MMYFVLLAHALFTIWLFIELVTAKINYQDESGFHYGSEPASTNTTATGDGEQISVNPAHV